MRTTVRLAGMDVSWALLRGGVKSLKTEVQDTDGNQTMAETTMEFCNFSGVFDQYVDVIDPIEVEVFLEGHPMLRGLTVDDGLSFDRDNETFELRCLPCDYKWIAGLKNRKCDELADLLAGRWRVFNILAMDYNPASNPPTAEGRWFVSVNDIISMFGIVGYPIRCEIADVDLTQYYIGGRIFHNQPTLPDISWWELIKSVADVWNGFWYYQDRIMRFQRKDVLVRGSTANLDPDLERGSFIETNVRVGYDSVDIKYENGNDNSVWSGATVGMASQLREGVTDPVRKLEKTLSLKIPNIATFEFFGYNNAHIDRTNDDTGYLIYNPTGDARTPEASFTVLASDILQRYLHELNGLTEWQGTYILFDDPAKMETLMGPMPSVLHPLKRKNRYVVRSCDIDPEEETATVNIMGYAA